MRKFHAQFVSFLLFSQLALPIAKAEDFDLKAEKVEALEGGPVVIKLDLSYHGKNPVEAEHGSLYPATGGFWQAGVSAPKEWKEKELPGRPFALETVVDDGKGGKKKLSIIGKVTDGTAIGPLRLTHGVKPGDRFSQIVFFTS